MACIDLKSTWRIMPHFGGIGGYARRQVGVLASDGVSSVASVRYVRPSVRWRLQNQNVSLQQAIASHGLCSTDLPGEPSRYRNLFTSREGKTVSHGDSQRHLAQQPVECQPDTRLANLRRLRPDPDRPSTIALRRRGIGNRFAGNRLCTGRLHDRSLPVDVSLGRPRGLSKSIRCSTSKAPFPNSSLCPTENCTM